MRERDNIEFLISETKCNDKDSIIFSVLRERERERERETDRERETERERQRERQRYIYNIKFLISGTE